MGKKWVEKIIKIKEEIIKIKEELFKYENLKFFTLLGIVCFLLTGFFFSIKVTDHSLMDILFRSWKTGFMKETAGTIRGFDPLIISFSINFLIGFYLGSTYLLYRDRKKRIQAILLSIGIILIYNYTKDFIEYTIIIIAIGALVGFILGGGIKKKKFKEYRKAANNIGTISTIYILISFLNLYFLYPVIDINLVFDSIILLSFAFLFKEVMNYTGKSPKIMILGPKRSGKTLFLLGCYMRALSEAEETGNPIYASDDLSHLYQLLSMPNITWGESTLDIKNYNFNYEIGNIFPKNIIIETMDFPGVSLENITTYMFENVKNLQETEKNAPIVAKEVTKSDKLIFVLDSGQYPSGEMGIIHYLDIINKMHKKGKTVDSYIVVTKSDIFREESILKGRNPDDYEQFKNFIEEKFSRIMQLRQLLTVSDRNFYPVYYYTKKIDVFPYYIPERDKDGNLHTFGFKEFLEDIIKK